MPRRGYTFVELLLVLTVLAVLAGMAWPAVVRFTGEQAIKDASETVRSELDRTRFRAIDAGLVYQFRYEPNGRRFVACAAERDVAPAGQGTDGAATATTLPGFSGEIREGLLFQPETGAAPTAEIVSQDWFAGLPNAVLLSQSSWSSPIMYYPDGTGTNARFQVTDDQGRFIELSTRDLTGMATAGPLRKVANKWE